MLWYAVTCGVPLHIYPPQHPPGSSIPWQPEDLRLQQWLANDTVYQAAAAELHTCHAT